MKSLAGLRTLLSFVFLSLFIVACGGGGGGDGTPSGDGSLTVNPTSISLETEQNGPLPVSRSINISSSNPETYQIIAGYPVGTTRPSWLDMSFPGGGNTLNIFLTTTNLSPGTYTITVRVLSAKIDNSVIDVKDLPLTLTVTEPTVATPSNLLFSFVEGEAAPPVQSVSLSKAGNPVMPTSATLITAGTYFQAVVNGNQVDVSLTNAALNLTAGQGVFGTLRIFHVAGYRDVSLRVTSTSKALSVSSAPLFQINPSTQLADLTQNVTVDTNFTSASPVDWSASVEAGKPWLSVLPASGDTVSQNTLAVSIDQTQIGDMLNRNIRDGSLINHTAEVTLTSSTPGVAQVRMTVTLNLDMPHITAVAPNVATTGSTEEIILRGWGFSGLTNQTLYCGAQAATSYTALSDVEVRATCPVLATGSHEMEFDNSIGLDRNNALLYVEDAVAYLDEVISTTGSKTRIIYDPVRKAIYLANSGNQTLDRYVYDDTIIVGSKWLADNTSVEVIQDIALSTDGSYLYAGTDVVSGGLGGIRVFGIDPDTLGILSSDAGLGSSKVSSMHFLSGGEAVVTFGATYFDNAMRMQRVLTGSERSRLLPTLYNAVGGATRDGRRALVSGHENFYPGPAIVYAFDSASEPTMAETAMVSTGLSIDAISITSDRTGSKWVFDNTDVYSGQYVYLGALPATTEVSIMSHDGTVAYTVDSAGTLRKFDLTSVTAQQFAEIGAGTALAADPGNNPVMTISHDGGQIFIAGDQNLVIMTAP